MPDVLEVVARFRAQLAAREAATARVVLGAYADVLVAIEREVGAVTETIGEAIAAGKEPRAELLRQRERLARLEADVRRRVDAIARDLEPRIVAAQREAVALGASDELLAAAMGETPPSIAITFARANPAAIEAMVGIASDGGPLADLLAELGRDAGHLVRDALVRGVALGKGPRAVADGVRDAFGMAPGRALTVARTEMLRAYRSSSLETMRANRNVVEGWVWVSGATRRTCAACWARHGSLHPLEEEFASHPNCRCAAVPRTFTWGELIGEQLPDTRPLIREGGELFAALSEADQLHVLGPAKHRAYKAGVISLADLVEETTHPRWGRGIRERSLASILGEREAVRWAAAAAGGA